MPIDMSLFFPKQTLWPSIKWLGRHEWLVSSPFRVSRPGWKSLPACCEIRMAPDTTIS